MTHARLMVFGMGSKAYALFNARMRRWMVVRSHARRAVAITACVCFTVGGAGAAAFDAYPTRPLRFIVPYAPGGGGDILARSVAARLTEAWNQPVIIDNRGGGGTIIGTELVAKAPRDGYTILLSTNTHAINATLRSKLPYDPIRDFEPVSLLATSPNILLTNPAVPARTLKEFIALARSSSGTFNYGS